MRAIESCPLSQERPPTKFVEALVAEERRSVHRADAVSIVRLRSLAVAGTAAERRARQNAEIAITMSRTAMS